MENRAKNGALWLSLLILVAAIVLSIATYNRWLQLRFEVGPVYFSHLLGWIGTGFIALHAPTYYILKRLGVLKPKVLLNIHTFGNLIAFTLVSMHFAQQIGRPQEFYPDLGTGLGLYIAMCLIVITGFLQRFQFAGSLLKYWRFIHTGLVLSFYIIIVIHVLHGLGVI